LADHWLVAAGAGTLEVVAKRGTVIFSTSVVAIIALVFAAYFLIFDRPLPEPLAGREVAPRPTARIVQTDGAVELRVASGEWQMAKVGAAVGSATDLRTGAGASAQVAYGDSVQTEILPDTMIKVESLDRATAQIMVEAGTIAADVKENSGSAVRVTAANTDATAVTSGGRMHFATDGQGNVQAAASRGQAQVTARGKTVVLQPGFGTFIAAGEKPRQPMPMPATMLLKVIWPGDSVTAKRRQIVRGTTAPGARVRIGGTVVTADQRGEFRAVVELAEGSQRIHVYSIDVLGRRAQDASPAIRVDTMAPSLEVETGPQLWKRKTP
jgi:hypothetical protein